MSVWGVAETAEGGVHEASLEALEEARALTGPDGSAPAADRLGAALGGSRVPVDRGWLPWERQIGQSGRYIAPRLYLMFGISGASQHPRGIRQAEIIIAVNTDRTAPIFSVAHLGVVGDWREVVTALLILLRAREGGAGKAAGRTVGRDVAALLLEGRP